MICAVITWKARGHSEPGKDAHPYCGAIGELHTEREVRIETIIPAYKKAEAVKALLAAHPYEEPVYDIYPLQNSWPQAGAGVIGELEVPETELEFLKRIKKNLRSRVSQT